MRLHSRVLLVVSLILVGFMTACSGVVKANISTSQPQSVAPTAIMIITAASTEGTSTSRAVLPTSTVAPSALPTSTETPLPTFTPTSTATPSPPQTPTWVWNEPGRVAAPILLYHHVSDASMGSRYFVSVDKFRAQMQALHDLGYTTITPSYLIDVLRSGGEMPLRPVIITFDDGNLDIYENAFPVMRELGFVGAFYLVGDRLLANNYVHQEHILEMVDTGWEIGSHSMTHKDLTLDTDTIRFEVLQSRLLLKEATGEEINTFAYAYGKTDGFISGKVSEYGYRGAMGLGMSWEHSLGSLFYLNRREVQGDYDLAAFENLLPWSDE